VRGAWEKADCGSGKKLAVGGTWENVARSIGTKFGSALLGSASGPVTFEMGLDVVVPQPGLSMGVVCIGWTAERVEGTKLLCEVETEFRGRKTEGLLLVDGDRCMWVSGITKGVYHWMVGAREPYQGLL
jgi:hypothetical protein